MDFNRLSHSGILQIQPYVAGKPIDEVLKKYNLSKAIKIASNENPLGPGSLAREAVKNHINELHLYPDPNGTYLKQKLSEKFGFPEETITLGNGSHEVLDLIARTFVQAQEGIMYSQYAFIAYYLSAQAINAHSQVIPVTADWETDLEAMLAAITKETKLIYVSNPNNPLGTSSHASKLREFIEKLPEQLLLVVDEAYHEYMSMDPNYQSCVSWIEAFPNLIVTRTFSKAYGLAGARVGYALSHPQIADLLNRVRLPFNVNSLALVAATASLDDDEHIRHSIKINNDGLKQLQTGFDKLGITYIPSFANFILIDCKQAALPISNDLLKQGIIVRPVDNYGLTQHLRIGVGLPEENETLLKALSNWHWPA